ncbi:MAG: hypothetical protein RXR43_16410 [Sulfolobus sp.]
MRKDILIAVIISLALAIAILSLPDILEPVARSVLTYLGVYWALAVFIIGVIHGLKPDEHTWPITVSYGLMQSSIRRALLSTAVFAGALTIVWASLSALTSEVLPFFSSHDLDPYVDMVVGVTMISVALFILSFGKKGKVESADYRVIWIHGLAAAFGGDFIIVLVLTTLLIPVIPSNLGFMIGLLFGIGSFISQSVVVVFVYKGVLKVSKDFTIMEKAGKLALLMLGVFMIFLGVYSLLSL